MNFMVIVSKADFDRNALPITKYNLLVEFLQYSFSKIFPKKYIENLFNAFFVSFVSAMKFHKNYRMCFFKKNC